MSQADALQAIALPAGIRYIVNRISDVNQTTLQTTAIAAHLAFLAWDKYGTLITPAVNLAIRMWGLYLTLETGDRKAVAPGPNAANGQQSQSQAAASSSDEAIPVDSSPLPTRILDKIGDFEFTVPILSWASFALDGIAILPHYYAWQCTLRKKWLESTMNNLATPQEVAEAAFKSHQGLRTAFKTVKAFALPLHYGSTILSIAQLLFALHQIVVLRRTDKIKFSYSVLIPVNAFTLLSNLWAISTISFWA